MAERAAKQLELNKSELPNSITEVIATLSRAGFDAYIVGGGVRDTLLGLKPKDFDAVTDAKPHEIKDVFGKRCRIIGRRFQLAHVYSGRELIEVATFRGPPNNDANTNQDGMIIRDNVWGDIKQDFARRDFSINALYYQPLKGVVHDYCGALDDIDNKIIRLLGHAPVRIEEDPVRLLRALRFKAKLGFEFDEALAGQFHDGNWALLEQISPHRLYDETQKMFTGGYLVPLLPLLFESGAIDSLFIYPPSEPSALVQQVAINTDKRIAAGKSINPAFFYAAILWENYLHQLEKAKKRNMPFAEAQMQAASKVIDRQRIKTAIPKFAEQFIRDIWLLQPKLAAPRSKQIEQLSEHPRFRAGFDFLLLREQCGDAEHPLSESTNGMGDWWQTYQTLSESQQQQAINDFDENLRRGAYKQGKNGQRGRGGNRQNPVADYADSAVESKSAQPVERAEPAPAKDHAKQSTVNDASNIPSRRRRRSENEAVQTEVQAQQPIAKSRNSNARKAQGSNKRTPQAKHDSNELAQLQQLSLASNHATGQANKASSAQPAPLFVIEHKNVVPPLQKQLAQVERAQPSKAQMPVASAKSAKTVQQQQSKAHAPVVDAKAKVIEGSTSTSQQPDSQTSATKAATPRVINTNTQIAKTPQMVHINNAPIPYKRRRQQPSVALTIAADKTNATVQYEKKAPKPAPQSQANKAPAASKRSTAAKAKTADVKAANTSTATNAKQQVTANSTAAKQGVSNQGPGNQGPVPSKRRRRQPSTDVSAADHAASKHS